MPPKNKKQGRPLSNLDPQQKAARRADQKRQSRKRRRQGISKVPQTSQPYESMVRLEALSDEETLGSVVLSTNTAEQSDTSTDAHLKQASRHPRHYIRTATTADHLDILSIFTYYVTHTTITFLHHPPDITFITSRYETSLSHNLPYLVIVDKTEPGKVLGYAHASPFSTIKLGYLPTVEMTLYLHPDHRGQGLGSRLLDELIARLRQTRQRSWEASNPTATIQDLEVKNVIAIMSIDESQMGEGLAQWYVKRGFEITGRLKGIGWKFGRAIDEIFLQLRL